jgi:xanthine dehydrogenase accessory factor
VGAALAEGAVRLGFKVTVADDRPEFAAPGRFGPEVATMAGGYSETIAAFPADPASYAVILTRGHLFDLESCRAILKREWRYAGLIGSKRKVGMIRGQLAEDGYPAERIASLHSPIGLDIGAETPEEIAISILAEMIGVRHGAF